MGSFVFVSLEILTAGVTASIWIVLLVIRVLSPDIEIESLTSYVFSSMSVANFLVVSIIVYSIGWIVHFASESLLDPLFQRRFREKHFSSHSNFYDTISMVFQKGSSGVYDDIKFDRHALRIARSNVLNFFLLAVVSSFYISVSANVFIATSLISLVISLLSFLQWKSRYIKTYRKIQNVYKIIMASEIPNPTPRYETSCLMAENMLVENMERNEETKK